MESGPAGVEAPRRDAAADGVTTASTWWSTRSAGGEQGTGTTAAGTLRASVRVEGVLDRRVVPMLRSLLGTHVRSGRRYLRLDLRQATISGVAVLDSLLAVQASPAELGGLSVLDVDAVRSAEGRDDHVDEAHLLQHLGR